MTNSIDNELSQKVINLFKITATETNPKKKLVLFDEVIQSTKGKWQMLTADFKELLLYGYGNAGVISYIDLQKSEQALKYYKQAINLNQNWQDDWQNFTDTSKDHLLACYRNAGSILYEDFEQPEQALAYYKQSFHLSQDWKKEWQYLTVQSKESLLCCYINAASILLEELPKQALVYYNQAMNLCQDWQNEWHTLTSQAKKLLLVCYGNAGSISYIDLQRLEQALKYYKQAINLNQNWQDDWQNFTDTSKECLLDCYRNAGILYEDFEQPEQALAYYKQSFHLSQDWKKEWQYLTVQSKESLLCCYINAASILLEELPKQALVYYNQAMNLCQDWQNEWHTLTSQAKKLLLVCYGNSGVNAYKELQLNQALAYYNQAINLSPDWQSEWHTITQATEPLLVCFSVAGSILKSHFQKPEQALAYYNQAINLCPNWQGEWQNLNAQSKENLLVCYRNAVNIWIFSYRELQKPKQALAYYNQAIHLSQDWQGEWQTLTANTKDSLLTFYRNAGVLLVNHFHKLEQALTYFKQGIALAFNYFDSLNQEAQNCVLAMIGNSLFIHSNNQLPQRHQWEILSCFFYVFSSSYSYNPQQSFARHLSEYINGQSPYPPSSILLQASLDASQYLIVDIQAIDAPWIFPKRAKLLNTLSQALLIHNWQSPSNIIQSLQHYNSELYPELPPSNIQDNLISPYIDYLCHTHQWHSHRHDSYHQTLLRFIAHKQPTNNLTQLYDIWQQWQTKDSASRDELLQLLHPMVNILNQLNYSVYLSQSNDYQFQISHLFSKSKLQIDPALNTLGDSQNWLNDCNNKMADMLADSLLTIDYWDKLSDIQSFISKLSGNTPDMISLWQAWLTGEINDVLTNHTSSAVEQQGKQALNPLLQLMPESNDNRQLLKTLKLTQQHLLIDYLKEGQLEQIYRSLELQRLAINNRYLDDMITNVSTSYHRISHKLGESVTQVLQEQQAVLYHYLTTEDDSEFRQRDPFAVFNCLGNAFERHNIQLQVIEPSLVQAQLTDGQAIVQLWHQTDKLMLLLLDKTELSLHTLVLNENLNTLDIIQAWQQQLQQENLKNSLSGLNRYQAVRQLTNAILKQMEAVLQTRQSSINKIVLIADADLAVLPWHYHPDTNDHDSDGDNPPLKHPYQLELAFSVNAWYEKATNAQGFKLNLRQVHMAHQLTEEGNSIIRSSAITEAKMIDAFNHRLLQAPDIDTHDKALGMLSALSKPTSHHILAHGRFNPSTPTDSRLYVDGEAESISAWQLAFADVSGDLSLSVCQALNYNEASLDTDGSNLSYKGAIGLGASLSSAHAVVGSSAVVSTVASVFFNYFYQQYRWQYDAVESVVMSQQRLRELTLQEVRLLLGDGHEELMKGIDVQCNVSVHSDGNIKLFSHPIYWANYTVFGNAVKCNYTVWQLLWLRAMSMFVWIRSLLNKMRRFP